jgi:polysaccharide pyruvyl transferase WcaK-like protein
MSAAIQFTDSYWLAASEQALRAAEDAECVLVPAEFLHLHPRFMPLEFSWGLRGIERLAWCCSKDDVDRLAPWLHAAARDPEKCAWSNEVFVVGGTFRWARAADAQSRAHLNAWFERLDAYGNGVRARQSQARPLHEAAEAKPDSAHLPRVLLVGASRMGNVGDDLIAAVLGDALRASGAELFVSGPDIDPLDVTSYDAVVVGGGGLIYASRDGSNECQNLANYLKFGPIARQFGIPAALVGVGDQDHADGIERLALARQFATEALPGFDCITTRDADSTELLCRLNARSVRTGADPVFGLLERARRCVRSTSNQPQRIALIGELYSYSSIATGIGDGSGPLAAEVREGEFDLLIMSDDDVVHCERMQTALQKAGAAAAIVDLRGRDFGALIFLFASYRAVITTRFHGLVLAAMAHVPVVALDSPYGKKARLLRELGAADCLIEDSAAAGSLIRALRGEFARLPGDSIERVASACDVHLRTLRELVQRVRISKQYGGETQTRATAVDAHVRAHLPETAVSALAADAGTVGLCWAASSRHTQGYANLGDSLSAVVVAALSGLPVRHLNFDEPRTKLVAVGSIGHAIQGGTAVVWGSGVSIRGGVLAQNVPLTCYDIRAIRGTISAQHFRDFGIAVPEVYGDPVWLLPSIFNEPVEKKYELGVIPHIQDIERPHPDARARVDSLRYVIDTAEAGQIALINTWHEPTLEGLLAKIRLIRSCKRIVSQSFHGVVIAEAYGIPVLNFRNLPKTASGLVRIDLNEPCQTDPRIWEFYAGGPRRHFQMYNQRRDERSDWQEIIRCVDAAWEPFDYDPQALIESFPLPLAYDPLRATIPTDSHLRSLAF